MCSESSTNALHTFIEELLIDFHELEGEHLGANLAEATWDTLKRFGIESWVSQIPCDVHSLTLTPDHGLYDGQCVKQ